jgi:hypothetical protein
MLRIDDQEAGEEAWSAMGMRAAPFRRDLLHLAIARSTPILDLGRAFRADIRESRNVSLLLHATATALHTNAYGTAIERYACKRSRGSKPVYARARLCFAAEASRIRGCCCCLETFTRPDSGTDTTSSAASSRITRLR